MNRFAIVLSTATMYLGGAASLCAADNPTFDVNWYGFVKLDCAYDQNHTSNGNYVLYVDKPEYEDDDEQFNMTANETRLGINIKGKNYEGWDVGARVELDLYGSVTNGVVAENKAMLQLRHAYLTVQRGHTRFLAGQTWDLISPLNPSTLNYTVLWGCGNIGYRRPQVSLWQTVPLSKVAAATFAGGLSRTIGSDLMPTISLPPDTIKEGADDGTDAGNPSVQGLAELNITPETGAKFRFGMSGLWGRLKAETSLGNEEEYDNWAVAGHARIDFTKSFSLQGEVYTGSNLGSYMGAITRSSTVSGLSSTGGWGAAFVQAHAKVNLSAGFGIDDVDDSDIADGRTKNTACFGTMRYTIIPQVTFGLEISQWETQYVDADDATSFRVQTSFILNY